MNQLFRGANFDISDSLCQVLTMVFTCFMYSGGMPLLNVICFVGLVFTYWCNKVLIFRHYRKPPVYSADINRRVIKILPFAVFFHCTISLYMFGSPDIFPEAFQMDPTGKYVQAVGVTIAERLGKNASVANIIVIILSLTMFTAFLFLLRKYNDMKLKKVFDESQFFSMNTEGIVTGTKDITHFSYDIMENPKYQKLIHQLNLAASRRTRGSHGNKISSRNSYSDEGSCKQESKSVIREANSEEEKLSEGDDNSLFNTGAYQELRLQAKKSCPV